MYLVKTGWVIPTQPIVNP